MRARILFGLALVACARTPKPPADELPPEPPPDETSEAGTPAAAVPVPMTIASSSHPPAPWHLPPIDRVISPDALDGTFEDAAVGHSLALVRWAGGMLVVDADAGVRGTLALPPDAVWTGVDGDDRVLHATADGSVWRAESWDATPVRVGTVPGALAWDLAPHALVVLSESAVMRSTDGGARFEPLPPLPRRLDDPQILTRDDGAVVVQGRDESGSRQTLLLPPRGRRWVAGPAELGPLVRTGAWIGDAELDGCGTVLARDARRWVEAQLEDELARWSELAELEEELAPAPLRRLPTLTWPAAPRSSAACDGGADLWGAMGTGGTEDGEPIRGTTGPEPQPTARWARLLSDAVCDRLPDDEWSCDDAVPLRRAPHAAQWDERDRSLRIVSLPPACARPLRLDSAAGLGVLRCAEPSAVALWTLGPDGQWHGEGRLPHDDQAPGALTAADDGTLLLHGRCRLGSCERSWLRPPAALGEGAWVELDPADTLAFRVLDGGRALRIAGRRDQGYSLTVLEPGRPDQRLTTRLASEGRPLITMEVTPERTLRVAFGQEGPPIERMIDEHGRPQPVPPSPLRGGWRGPVLLANDSYPMVAAIGDYDDDGVDDLAVVQRQVAPHREVVVIVRGWGGLGELGPDALDGEDQVIVELDVPMLLVDELRGVGDVDGDGHDDLAITVVTPSSTGSGTEAETYVVLGRSTTDPRQLSAVRKGEGGFWIGGFPEGRSYAVTTGPLGDIDGDGRDDLGLSFPARGSDPGRLYVVLGKEGGSWVHLGDVARGRGGMLLQGTATQPFRGGWSALGDFDGDGGDDLAVVLEHDDLARVHVRLGGKDHPLASGSLPELVAQGGLVVQTATAAERTQAWAAGDLDGDGRRELAIAQIDRDGLDLASGRVALVYGRARPRGVLSLPPADLDQGVAWILGDFAFDHAGRQVAALGDRDGDGRDELAVAAPDAVRHGEEVGRVYVLRGGARRDRIELSDALPPARGWVLPSIAGQSRLGQSLLAAGDLDGDHRPDLLLTAALLERSVRHGPVHVVLGLPGE